MRPSRRPYNENGNIIFHLVGSEENEYEKKTYHTARTFQEYKNNICS